MERWNLLIALHAFAAVVAVGIGAGMLRMRRKGNRAHRRLGRVWMATMYFVVLSSFGIRQLHPGHFSWIHGLSVFTFGTLTVAWWAARTGRRRRHRDAAVGTYLGLLGAGIAAMAFPVRLAPQLLVHQPLVFVAAGAAAGGVALTAAAWARRPRRQPSSASANGRTTAAPA